MQSLLRGLGQQHTLSQHGTERLLLSPSLRGQTVRDPHKRAPPYAGRSQCLFHITSRSDYTTTKMKGTETFTNIPRSREAYSEVSRLAKENLGEFITASM